MTDEVVNGQDQASEAPPVPAGPEVEDVAQLPAWAQKMINALRKDAGDYRKQLRDFERAQKNADEQKATEQGEFKSLYEKAKSERDSLEAKLRAAELDAMRTHIGAEFGLPPQLAARLQGDTEETMRADAETLKGALPTPSAAPTGTVPRVPAGNPGESPKSDTDADRRTRLYGGGSNIFSQSGGVRVTTKSEA